MVAIADARPVSQTLSSMVYLRSIAVDAAHKLLKRRNRSRDLVSRDYDAGDWKREAEEAAWLSNDSLDDYVDRAHLAREMRVTVGGRLHEMSAPSYYRFRRHKLAAIMEEFAPDAQRLVELGSGTGAIVFELAASLKDRELVGLDLSERGIAVARTVADHYALQNVSFDRIDLLDPSSPGWRRLEGETVYSHYCLEQLPRHTEAIFRSIVASGAKRAVLIEPSFELLGLASLRDLATRSYVLRQDYQRSILQAAETLENEGLVRVVEVRRLDFVSSHRNFGTLLVFDCL
ncbi:MAG: class I SAM-dependent methyltransferase [Erythrobacter sp.]